MKTKFLLLTIIGIAFGKTTAQASQTTNPATTGQAHVNFPQRFVSFTMTAEDTLTTTFQIPQFPPCRGTLRGVRVRLTNYVDPIFKGRILVPTIAGVNANIDFRFTLSVPGSTASIDGNLYFNDSGTFTPQNPTAIIDYPPQKLDSGFQTLPISALPLFRGGGSVAFPRQIKCVEDATVSNTGMICQFGTDIQIGIQVVYDYTSPPLPSLVIRQIGVDNDGSILLTWDSRSCTEYVVQDSTNLTLRTWKTLGYVIADGPSTTVRVPFEDMPQRFFRVIGVP